jgi:hypothetical protein
MDFRKISIFNLAVIAFNITLGLHDLSWYSSVQFAFAGMLIWLEVRTQINHHRLRRFQRQIEANTFYIEDINALFADPVRMANLPPPIFHLLVDLHRTRFNHADNVDWKRDGF